MSTNANVFNSRVTSEALEAKFRQVFPAQAGAELIQDLYASGVIQPVIDFSSVAEGSFLAPNLQTAWDLSTGSAEIENATTTLINNTGFWKIDLNSSINANTGAELAVLTLVGTVVKNIWAFRVASLSSTESVSVTQDSFVVFLKAGESLQAQTNSTRARMNVWWRQIADVNGNLVNPLGFTFS